MKVISVQTMRDLDRRTIEQGTPGKVLMERAGRGVFREIKQFMKRLHGNHCQQVVVFAGKGNNGGDAFVVAGLLAEETPLPVKVYAMAPKKHLPGDAREFAEKLPGKVSYSVIKTKRPENLLNEGDFVVDGLLGTGISGPLKAPYDSLIKYINTSRCPVVSIDIPSGLNGDTGEIATDAVLSDLTVTMAFPKRGMLSANGLRKCGELRCIDIGIDAQAPHSAEVAGEALFARDIAALLKRRPSDGHKGTFGTTLTIGGSRQFVGAPVLSGTAALRSGCGLSTVLIPDGIRQFISAAPQALIFIPAPDKGEGIFNDAGRNTLKEALNATDSIVLGPGIGRSAETAEALAAVLATEKPILIDADALRLTAGMKEELNKVQNLILTPHPGEMQVVLKGLGREDLLTAEREEQAKMVAQELGAVVVLKGQGTLIAGPDGRLAVNTSGNNALASGGTGDVLSGLIGGFTAQGYSGWDAACLGVFVHGRAAEIAVGAKRSLIADDLLNHIGEVFCELSPFA